LPDSSAIGDLAVDNRHAAASAHPMSVNDAVNIEDLHRLAKRRLPKIAFDFIEGGVEDERGLARTRRVPKAPAAAALSGRRIDARPVANDLRPSFQ
jgi:hypothetical protein